MEVIDNIQTSRGRYNDLSLRTTTDDDNISISSGRNNNNGHRSSPPSNSHSMNSLTFEIEKGVMDDDNSSVVTFENDDDDISISLERELTRRVRRKFTKYIVVGLAGLLFIMVAIFYKAQSTANNISNSDAQQQSEPEIGGKSMTFDIDDDPFNYDNEEEEENNGSTTVSVEEGIEDIQDLASLFHAKEALPMYKICAPPMVHDRPEVQKGDDVFHMGEFRIVPEDPTNGDHTDVNDADDDELNSPWYYTLSDMDVNNDASIIALGLGDYAADTGYSVGMVRVYAYACDNGWQRLGQDLIGEHEYEMFGHRVSSNKDGTVLAISAPQGDYSGGNGFVEVYSIDIDVESGSSSGLWVLLGSRIDALPNVESEYYMLGHAVDISDSGESLAILGIVDDEESENASYVTRVFDYDYRAKEWKRKGKDLVIKDVTYGPGGYDYDYSPQVSLSEKGDRLIITDPEIGVVKYHFVFSFNHWKEEAKRTPVWNEDINNTHWIQSMDLDDRGELITYSAFEEDEDSTIVNAIKIIDFSDADESIPVDVHTRHFRGWSVSLSVSVSDQGNVAAYVASKLDVDDVNWWEGDFGGDWDEDVIGSLTVLTQYEDDEVWSVIGKGTDAENLGVAGSQVYLSGEGKIAAVGYDTVVSLYGINLDRPDSSNAVAEVESQEAESTTVEEDAPAIVNICAPPSNTTTSITDLPQMKDGDEKEQHTISLSLSSDGSIVAAGIDSFDGEDRGLVRTFAWSCDEAKYVRLGQDLLGSHEFDGFGQSVDLSANGKRLAIGANQPPPGKAGYIDIYELQDDSSWKSNHRIKDFNAEEVSDIGRTVKISDDGDTLMILGSSVNEDSEGGYDSSFLRVMRRNKHGKWNQLGDDILGSVDYDDHGISCHATMSGGGHSIIVTGSYGDFFAKVYKYEEATSSWIETVTPTTCDEDESKNDDDAALSEDYYSDYCYFSGEDIAVNHDASVVAVVGTSWGSATVEGTLRFLTMDPTTGNYTVSGKELDFADDYYVSSVDISHDGKHLVVGINDHSDNLEGQGQSVSFIQTDEGDWGTVNKVDGKEETDLLGARVCITNSHIAAATSRKGYITIFGS